MFLVLIETSANQRYIFATNKLRENVGASELTYQIGTKYVLEAIGKSDVVKDDSDGNKLRGFLLDDKQNPFKDKDGHSIEVIVATSGKALLLVNDKNKANEIVSCVTKRALIEMPGLTVHGTICEVDDDLSYIHGAIGNVHRRLEEIRFKMPSNEQRFLRLPFVASCSSSGLPASTIKQYKGENEPKRFSCTSSVKSDNRDAGYSRIGNKFSDFKFIEPEEIEKCKWVAVIHADGNGVGEIFLKFKEHCGKGQKEYIDAYRRFSDALDDCTTKAACYAFVEMKKLFGEQPLPIVPLVLGGDDLTVFCDGQYALKFAYDFLTKFENHTTQSDIIKAIGKKAFHVERLGICAGVAIIKPHYPFHQAYELAEQLLKSAKQVKTKIVQADERQFPCSALDFHIVYDSTNTDLDSIRDRLTVDSTNLFAKPYVVTKNLDKQENNTWLKFRKFEELQKRVEAMRVPAKEDATRRALPNSKLHEIRQSLFRGQAIADAEARLIENRCSDEAKKQFGELKCGEGKEKKTIFFTDGGEEQSTHFLDALEVVDFWEGFTSTLDTSSKESEHKGEPAESEVKQ